MTRQADVVGVALVGVLAWRPNSLDAVVQRPLLPIVNRPWTEHLVRWLRLAGIERVAISTNRLTDSLVDLVRRVARDLADVQIFVDGPPRGPAGCCRDVAETMPAARYVVVEGNVIPRLDLRALLGEHRRSGAAATVVINGETTETGPPAPLAQPAGIHVAERDFLLAAPETGYQDLKEMLINRAVRGGAVVGVYRSPVYNPRITDLGSYLDAQELLLLEDGVEGLGFDFASGGDSPRVYVHPSAEVAASARITGPAVIGADTVIHQQVAIIGPCSIGSGCSIGENAVVTETAVWDNSIVSDETVLSECVVCSGTFVAARTRKERELLLGSVTR